MSSTTGFKYKFTLLGRYAARLRGNEPHVTLNMLAGRDDQLVYCGSFTMSEAEWEVLREALIRGLGSDFEVDDHSGRPSRRR